MKRSAWTPAEDAAIRDLYATHSAAEIAVALWRSVGAVFQRANNLGLKKTRAWIAERAAQAMADPEHGGHASQFRPGQDAWNKGLHYQPGGRCAETQFKPGVLQGRALALWHPVGSLRIDADGYLQRKINDDLPMHKRWRAEHLVIWEAAHGPLPAGHAVVFKDGNKQHVTLDNLELVSRAELMRRNTVHRHGPEIAALVQLRGALRRQINRRQRSQQPGEETP